GVNAEVLSSDFAIGLDVLSDAILSSTFPAEPLARERDVQIASIYAQRDHLLKNATVAMRRGLFGDSGYGLDPLGTEEIVANLGASELTAFHRQRVNPKNCVLAIFGDVTAADVRARVESAFAGWQPGAASEPAQPVAATAKGETGRRVEDVRDKKQAV